LGNTKAQTLKKRDGFGNKDFVLLLENQAGGDYLIFFHLMVKEDLLDLSSVTDMLVSLKKEMERCLGKLGVG
jgi:hypothetical protein